MSEKILEQKMNFAEMQKEMIYLQVSLQKILFFVKKNFVKKKQLKKWALLNLEELIDNLDYFENELSK